MQTCYLGTQLASVTRLGQSDVSQVKLYVKVGILYPVGPVQAGRDGNQAGSEQWLMTQAALKCGYDPLEADESFRGGGWVVQCQSTNMLWRVGLLQVDEGAIEHTELLHSIDTPQRFVSELISLIADWVLSTAISLLFIVG